MKILTAMIVEDNDNDAVRLQNILAELRPDLRFVVCKDGVDALEYLQRTPIRVDLFFIDRELPKMDGFTFAERIREMDPYAFSPVVFVT